MRNESLQKYVLEGRIKGNGRMGDHTTRRTLDLMFRRDNGWLHISGS